MTSEHRTGDHDPSSHRDGDHHGADAAAEADEGQTWVDDTDPSGGEPTLAELLAGTAAGDQPSFSAFYDATADVVYGLALLVHADAAGAADSTRAVYQHLWDQADARARDLRLQTQTSLLLTNEYATFEPDTQPDSDPDAQSEDSSEPAGHQRSEYELVLEWLVPLAHGIFVERFRESAATPIPLTLVPQNQGGGVAGLPEEVIDDLLSLSDAQAQALSLTYLGGQSHQQVADTVGAAVPAVKSRLRDAMTRLHNAQLTAGQEHTQEHTGGDPLLRAAVTTDDLARGSGVNRNFTNDIAADLERGLLTELSELYAMDAVDDRERALLDEKALTASAQDAQTWETRVLAARRTLAEMFAAYPVAPPSGLLDEVLGSVGEQEIGMGMVEGFGAETEEAEKQVPKAKRWMLISGFIAVIVVGALVTWWIIASTQDVQQAVESDENAIVIEGYEMAEGGLIDATFSEEENLGYLEFSEVPELEGNNTYQLWLLPRDGTPPSSMGNFTAEELQDEGTEIHQLGRYQYLQVTVEEIRGQERPMGESVADLPLESGLPEDPDDA